MQTSLRYKTANRDGAIVPLFAILLPVLLVLAAYSVNLAYMQLTTTELRIATDVTSHAGGRALNVFQNMDNPTAERVIDKLRETVDRYYVMNTVAGENLTPPGDVSYSAARGGSAFNGVGVQANIDTDFIFDFRYGGGSLGSFAPTRNSVTKQVERDLAIVIDRSGSMLQYKEVEELQSVLEDMQAQGYISESELRIARGFQEAIDFGGNNNFAAGLYFVERGGTTSVYRPRFRVLTPHFRQIGNQFVFRNDVDVITGMENFRNANPGDGRDIDAMLKYMKSWEGVTPYNGNRKPNLGQDQWRAAGMFNDHAPIESRWDYLFRGIQDFVEVLETTPAEETISLVAFDSQAEALVRLTSDYTAVLDEVETIIPNNGTAIEKGMTEGLELVLEQGVTRPFAEKVIVVMTDGVNSEGGAQRVIDGARDVVADAEATGEEITIHTLTFGDGTGITPNPDFPHASEQPWRGAMVEVAEIGNGEHFHAEEAEELQPRLRQIANIQPTIFTF